MNSGNILTIASLFYIILLMVVYFSKPRIKNIENRIYSSLLRCNFIGLISAILCYFTVLNYEKLGIINYIVSRIYLLYLVAFIFFFFTYLLSVVSRNAEKTLLNCKRYFTISFIVISILIYYLPLSYENTKGVYSYGASANVVYIVATVCMVSWTIILLRSRHRASLKKLLPIAIFILGAMITTVIQKINPALLLMTSMESFVIFLMYFTIENPDVRMLNELSKNKELMEQNYEDKYNFLFEMTQEARNPLININDVCRNLQKSELGEDVKQQVDYLNILVRQLDFSINNILNVSSLDVQKLKIINSKYDLEKLCNELIVKINPEVKENVSLKIDMPKQVPVLYGDYMKLRQILYSVLINACKNTNNGTIVLKVNLIEKYDVCRVIFNIADTGIGMSIAKINELISATGELDKKEIESLEKKEYNIKLCQKVIKIMGGNMMIKSNLGKGTDVIITIDQRVHHEDDKSVLTKYETSILTYRKVLVVAQNKKLINNLKQKLNDSHITSSVFYYGKDAVSQVMAGKKYDFILIEDELKEMSGYMTYQALKEIKNFDIPVVIMLNEDKEKIKDHYLEDGFNDYLLVSNFDNEIARIIEKY